VFDGPMGLCFSRIWLPGSVIRLRVICNRRQEADAEDDQSDSKATKLRLPEHRGERLCRPDQTG